MFKERMILKTEMYLCGTFIEEPTNNGTLSIQRTGKENQAKENSTKTSVSMLKEISILSLAYQREDMLTSSEETWSSRHRMVEDLNSTTSINNPGPSDADNTTGHSTSKVPEEATTCNSGALTLDGGKSSNTTAPSSPTLRTPRYSMLQVEEIKKPTTCKYGRRMEHQPRDGRLSTLMLWEMKLIKPRVWIKTSDSRLRSHSISDLNSQCKE